ncbi:DDE-type integrase/transposase/recombinase [Ixodes scapularis]
MAELQRDDPKLRVLIKHLEGQTSAVPRAFLRILPTFFIRQGVLYKENFVNSHTAWLLVIPSSLREEIFQGCHDDPSAGHLGYIRTLARIREKYYWPRLPKTVHLYTRSCHECQRREKPLTEPSGLLHPISPPSTPSQQIEMDLLGPFLPSTSGNRWIIVATDYVTRYAETKALPSGAAVEVAKFFIGSLVLRHGAPEVLITDRGYSFMAQPTQEILRLSGTGHRRTTAYHPQTNGLTERLNKTIADMIAMYADVEHKTWDEVLPYVTFAYNTAVQETTGVTPFQLAHCRKVTTMLDAMLPHEPADDGIPDAQVDEASTSKEKHTMHAAAHRAQMKDMLDEKKREEEGKEIRHQRVVAKMQKKIDFLEDELLRERQLSRSLTDALLKGRAQYASSSASAAEPKPRRATFLAEVDISQPSTSKQQSCHFGAAATSPGIVFESLDGKVGIPHGCSCSRFNTSPDI